MKADHPFTPYAFPQRNPGCVRCSLPLDAHRPPLDEWFIKMAELVARRGTCSRLEVGCVIVRDKRVVSMGYNGAPPGLAHCVHDASDDGCTTAVHAELNAVAWAARAGISTDGATIYCTNAPCATCAQAVLSAGIARVVYRHPYRADATDLLALAGVAVERL